MSYSFSVKGRTRNEALAAALVKMGEVVVGQPIHDNDAMVALRNAGAAMALMAEPPTGKDVSLTMSGSVSWQGADGGSLTGVNASVSIDYVDVPVPPVADPVAKDAPAA